MSHVKVLPDRLYLPMMDEQPVSYRDHKWILLTIPFINAINYYLTYSGIKWDGFFALTFTLDTLEGYVAWYSARWIILKFDRKLPWEQHALRRLVLQLPLVALMVEGTLIFQTELVNFIARDKPLPTSFYTVDIFIFLIWSIFINFVYLGGYFFRKYQEAAAKSAEMARTDSLLVKTGRVQKNISLRSLQMLQVANELVYGLTEEGRIPLTGYTLDRLEKLLDPERFFRVNRQAIVTRDVVQEVRKLENGKLELILREGDPHTLVISRLRAPEFKRWLAKGSLA